MAQIVTPWKWYKYSPKAMQGIMHLRLFYLSSLVISSVKVHNIEFVNGPVCLEYEPVFDLVNYTEDMKADFFARFNASQAGCPPRKALPPLTQSLTGLPEKLDPTAAAKYRAKQNNEGCWDREPIDFDVLESSEWDEEYCEGCCACSSIAHTQEKCLTATVEGGFDMIFFTQQVGMAATICKGYQYSCENPTDKFNCMTTVARKRRYRGKTTVCTWDCNIDQYTICKSQHVSLDVFVHSYTDCRSKNFFWC
jgi:hypothetical protein